jgi:hypothetical protein
VRGTRILNQLITSLRIAIRTFTIELDLMALLTFPACQAADRTIEVFVLNHPSQVIKAVHAICNTTTNAVSIFHYVTSVPKYLRTVARRIYPHLVYAVARPTQAN